MAGVYGYSTKLGISASNPVDVRYDFISENLVLDETFVDTGGLRGTRSHAIERHRVGNRSVAGSIVMNPTAVELSTLLPWILGAAASGTTYALAETVPARYITIARDDGTDGKVFTYDGCKVNKATFRGSEGAPLQLTLDIIGIDETVGNAGSFPSLSLDTTTNAFMFTDLALSIASTAYNCKEIEIVIDNSLDDARFFNSVTRTAITARDRTITLNTSLPYGDAEAAYNTGIGGAATTATFTNGAVSLLFTFVKVVFPRKSPSIGGRDEIMVSLQGTALKSSTTEPLVVTLDSTP